VCVPVAWFLFTVRFSGRDQWLKRKIIWLFWVLPALTVLVALTSPWHHWLWTSIEPFSQVAGSPSVYEYGWWIFVHIGYSYLMTFLGLIFLFKTARRAKGLLRRQSQLLIIAGLIPIIGNFLYVFKINPWPPYDLGPLMFVIAGIMVGWAIFRWQLLEVIPSAQKTIFTRDADGEIILDPQNNLIAINAAAKKIIGVNFIPLGSSG